MAVRMTGRNFIDIRDFNEEEIMQMINTAIQLKLKDYRNEGNDLLHGRTMAMIFQKPSLRTRVSFEVGMSKLGGSSIYLGPDDIQLGDRETIEDIALVLSRYVDLIMARVFDHRHVVDMGRHASVPVINGLSDYCHPTQVMADLMTVHEKHGSLQDLELAFVGDGNNVAISLMHAASRLGLKLTLATPEEYAPDKQLTKELQAQTATSGGVLKVINDPEAAVRDVDIIYTDVWASMGQEGEREERREVFRAFQVNRELVDLARPEVHILHCMPMHYGEEITSDVVRDPRAQVIYDQAENRMYMHMALMSLLVP